MQVEFIEPASIELDDAIEYYELQMNGLGKIFFNEVLDTTELLSQFPFLWSKCTVNTRKAAMRKFPYNIIYSVLIDKIYVIALAHQHREPEYWIDRLNS